MGRFSHPNLQPHHALPLAPSAIQPNGLAFTEEGFLPFVTPRTLKIIEIPYIIEQYRHAAVCAKAAEFDGIELHAANGYLLDQFFRSGSNRITDGYGGSVKHRMRLIIEVMDALLTVWPADRIGIRLSSVSKTHNMRNKNPENTYLKLIKALNPNLVEKLQKNLPLREAPKETWYSGGEQGYTDWD